MPEALVSAFAITICAALMIRLRKTALQFALLLAVFIGSLLAFYRLSAFSFVFMRSSLGLLLLMLLWQFFVRILSPIYLDQTKKTPSKPVTYSAEKALIVVPHEDDEINLMAGLYEALVSQCETYVAFFTNGDAVEDNGAVRMKESIRALSMYGIQEDHIIFMGYGNRWRGPEKHIYHAAASKPMQSYCGKFETYALDEHPPFSECIYTRDNALNDFADLILSLKPGLIFASDCDWHSDHRAMSLLLDEAMGIKRFHTISSDELFEKQLQK